jgi:flagellar motor switch protein FliN
MTRDEIRHRFVTELTRVVGALLEASTSSRPGSPPLDDGFVVTIEGRAPAHGALRVFFGRLGAEALAKVMIGSALEPSEAVVLESLKELCGQTIGGLDERAIGAALFVAAIAGAREMPRSLEELPFDIVSRGHEHSLSVMLTGDLEVPAVTSGVAAAGTSSSQTLDVIMDIDLPLVVRFGRTELPLKVLTTLGPGSIIDLGRAPDDSVDVLISNRVVARGEVVIVAGSYGVRVRDVVSSAERARSLEAELA